MYHNLDIPLTLYIHLPWCIQKCPYCDFNSYSLKDTLPEQAYLKVLKGDFQASLSMIENRKIKAIFFGGGTPSLFSHKSIHEILTLVEKTGQLDVDAEITLEANPATVEYHDFSGYQAAGINRISLGIQSFNTQHLKKLGRIHTQAESFSAIKKLKKANFRNFNLDLMHGLANQSLTEALDDLKIALAIEPTHLSWYQLTIEPQTIFHKYPPTLPCQDTIFEMQTLGNALLEKNGFRQYEVSAYSQPKWACFHNLNYWQFGDYLGIGAGSHSKITMPSKKIYRIAKLKNPKDYIKAITSEKKILSKEKLPFEFMLNALRLKAGFELTLFEKRTFLRKETILPLLHHLVKKKLITLSDKLLLTDLGSRFLDDVVLSFLEEEHA